MKASNFCRYLFWLIQLVVSQVYFSEDPNYIQANQVSIYGQSFPLRKGVTVGVTFAQAFINLPYLFSGITEFSLAPTFQLHYRLKCLNYTNNYVNFEFFFAQHTLVYSSTVRYIAIMLPPLQIREYTYKPVTCNKHSFNVCVEYFSLSFSPSDTFYTYSLKGFQIKNQYVASNNDNFYSFHIKYGYNSSSWSLILTVGNSTMISALYVEYLIADLMTSNSNNLSMSIGTVNLTQAKNMAGLYSDLYTAGYKSTNTSTFIGLSSFILYPNKLLSFNMSVAVPLNIKLNTINDAQSVIYANILIVGVGKCLAGYQPIYNTSLHCVKCPLTCLQCWHYLCLTCSNDNMFLEIVNDSSSAGNCKCKPGFLLINNNLCSICDKNCYQCLQNPKNCISCLKSFTLLNNRCVNFCIINYDENSNNSCVMCKQGCSSCTASNACVNISCTSGTYYYEGSCVNGSCPNGTYFQTQFNSCMKCIQPCLSCTNYSICISCVSNFYLNIHNSLCYACYSSCLSCNGPSKTDCITCINNYALNTSTNQCVDTLYQICGLGKYLFQDFCYACLPGCEICNDQYFCVTCDLKYFYYKLKCLECVTGLKIVDGKCIQVCGDGKIYYQECDDGNLISGDGCSANCVVESNYRCNQFEPSFCWSLQNEDEFTQKKSLINNSILLILNSESINFDNVHDVKISCIYYNNSLYEWRYMVLNNSIEITLSFFDHFQDNICNVTLGKSLVKYFEVNQLPQALYYKPEQIQTIFMINSGLKILCFVCLVGASLTHFFSNSGLSYNFLVNLNIYVLTLFNYRYLSILVFNFITNLKYVYMLFEFPYQDFLKYQYDQNYIFEFTKNGFASNSKLIFLIFGFFLFIIIIFRIVYAYILKSIKKMYQINIKEYKVFLFRTFTAYQPILFFCFMASWKNNQYKQGGPIQIIFLVLFMLLLIANGVFIVTQFSVRKKFRQFFLNFGLQKMRNYILVLLLSFTDNTYCYSCFLMVLTSLALISMKLVDVRNKKKELTELRKKLALIQTLINQMFVLIINVLILAVYISSMGKQSLNYKKRVDETCGWFNVILLLFFLVSNFTILMINLINKIYRIIIYNKANKVIPQARTTVHNKDVQSEDGGMQKQKNYLRKTDKKKMDSTITNFHRNGKKKTEETTRNEDVSNYKEDISNTKIIFSLDD